MDALHFRFEPEDEWHGELIANVTSEQFQARGSAWFNTDELRRFSKALAAYPLKPDALPSITGGSWDDAGKLKQTHLAVDVVPHGLRGLVRFTVRLATEVDESEENDLGCAATVRFLATYADLSNFAADLSALAEGQIEAALLRSTAQ
jgi:hypothetical protein